MKALLVLLSLSSLAQAEELSLDEIVKRARAVADKKPQHVACKMTVETQVYDRSGKLEHHEEREGVGTLDGDKADLQTTRAVRDGKPLTPDELKAQREKADKERAKSGKSDDDVDLSPLSSKNASGERFELLRKESLWGHDTYVLKVIATQPKVTLANGTLWLDAQTFVELKGEITPAKLPEHADWVKVQEQYTLENGIALPTYLKIAGGGHFLFMRKSFSSTMRWSACK